MESYSPFQDYFGLSKLLKHEGLDTQRVPSADTKSFGEMLNFNRNGNCSNLTNTDQNGFRISSSTRNTDDFLSMEVRSNYTSGYEEDDHRSDVSHVTTTDQTSGEDDVFTRNSSRCSSMSEYSLDTFRRAARLPFLDRESMTSGPYTSPERVDRLAQLMQMNYQLTSVDDDHGDHPRGCFMELRPSFVPTGRMVNKREMYCVLCKRNGETREFFTTHILKDNHGKVICPILRKYECPRCLATGDTAHTVRHCPFAEHGLGSMSHAFLTRRSSSGVRRRDN